MLEDNEIEKDKGMKLAEALLLRSDLMKKIEQIQLRIQPNLIVSGDKEPQEEPGKLIAQLRNSIQELENLVVRINRTNNETQIEGFNSLMEALAKRDSLKLLAEKLRYIRYSAQINNSGETILKSTIDISKLQSEIDQTGRAFRVLDNKIQEKNWTTPLKD